MGQVPRVRGAGSITPNVFAVAEQVDNLVRVVDQEIEFGEPQDPADPTSVVRAGDFATPAEGDHNGTTSNIAGSWVELHIEAPGRTTQTCTHNLYLSDPDYTLPVTGEPNCRWMVFGWQHDGTGGSGTTELMLNVWFQSGTVTVNAVALEVSVDVHASTLTIDGTHPLLLTLFFTRATRGIVA